MVGLVERSAPAGRSIRESLNNWIIVIPAQAGIQFCEGRESKLDPRLRGGDELIRGS